MSLAEDQDSAQLRVENLMVHFPVKRGLLQRPTGTIKAVDGISFSVQRGETFGLVGESGCGKTTTGRAILRLLEPTDGAIFFEDQEIGNLGSAQMRQYRQQVQMIFQDPFGSLNPRMTVGAIIGEPLQIHGYGERKEIHARVEHLLELVGLDPKHASRYPHAFSGGQRQRIGIARALASTPSFVICDEPISALDVSIQAQIVNLLEELQDRLGLTYLFIAHDLSMVWHVSDRVAVMYLGHIMELASAQELHDSPLHPYTVALRSAVPIPNPELERRRNRILLHGEVPSPADPPHGCAFVTRCPLAVEACAEQIPEFREVRPNHFAACHRIDEAGPLTGLPTLEYEPRNVDGGAASTPTKSN